MNHRNHILSFFCQTKSIRLDEMAARLDKSTFQNVSPATPTGGVFPVSSGINPSVFPQNFCQSGLVRCCLASGYQCGIRYPPVSLARPPAPGQAVKKGKLKASKRFIPLIFQAFGSYPWQAVILSTGDAYQGSGALIDHLHVLTAAHKVSAFM